MAWCRSRTSWTRWCNLTRLRNVHRDWSGRDARAPGDLAPGRAGGCPVSNGQAAFAQGLRVVLIKRRVGVGGGAVVADQAERDRAVVDQVVDDWIFFHEEEGTAGDVGGAHEEEIDLLFPGYLDDAGSHLTDRNYAAGVDALLGQLPGGLVHLLAAFLGGAIGGD